MMGSLPTHCEPRESNLPEEIFILSYDDREFNLPTFHLHAWTILVLFFALFT